MTWSSRHQLYIISTIALLIVVFIGFKTVKYIKQATAPSCFDTKQNGEETGVDCGGACAKICMADVVPLRIVWERPILVTDTTAAAVALLENKNTGYGLSRLQYTVKLYDKDGILANTPFTGETFLEPNTQTTLFMPPVKVGSLHPATAHFELNYVSDFEKVPASYQAARLSVIGYDVASADTRPAVYAKIVNPTNSKTARGLVLALVYDQKGNIIGASQTLLPALAAQAQTTVTFTWPQPFTVPLGRVEIIPRVSPF